MLSYKINPNILIGDDKIMNLSKRKKNVLSKLSTIGTTITLIAIKTNMVLAAETSGIGTAEVQTATDNIKRVITSIAMPLRWCTDFCKCSNCSN